MTFDHADCHPRFGWLAIYEDDEDWLGGPTYWNIPIVYFGA